jgi:hypothetical protein
VYRWWPNANAVAMAALMERSDTSAAETKGTSAIAKLRRQLRAVAEIFSQPVGRSVASMLAASEPDTELSRSFRDHFIFQRREEARTLLVQAMRDGEIRAGLDLDTVLDLLYGPLFYRLIAAQGSLQPAYADRILALLLEGISSK